jgi:carboxyl-terminal processing protease
MLKFGDMNPVINAIAPLEAAVVSMNSGPSVYLIESEIPSKQIALLNPAGFKQGNLTARVHGWLGWRRGLAVLMVALVGFISGCSTIPSVYREPPPMEAEARAKLNLQVFDRTWTLVNEKYFDAKFRGVDWAAMKEKYRSEAAAATDTAALYRVLDQLCGELKESHLKALNPQLAYDLRSTRRVGSGLKDTESEGKQIIVEVLPGGAAAEAGVQVGWVLASRNGQPFNPNDFFMPKLGHPIEYGFLNNQDLPVTLKLEPRLIQFTQQHVRELPDGYRYLRFDEFSFTNLSWLSSELKAHPTAPGVLIDLRYNPGGNLLAHNMAVEEFFDRKKYVKVGELIYRSGRTRKVSGFRFLSAHYEGKVVILIGPGSGSASEVFSHVLQHEKRATVVGRRSAGAVIVARMYRLPDGGRLQVPVIDFVGLKGERLEGRGVDPDIVLPEPTLTDWRSGRDRDLEAAVQILTQR